MQFIRKAFPNPIRNQYPQKVIFSMWTRNLADATSVSDGDETKKANVESKDTTQEILKNISSVEVTNMGSGDMVEKKSPDQPVSFAKLFKESKFTALTGPYGPRLFGKIVNVVNDDLYIDYGGKFYCICKRPTKNPQYYQRNLNVEIKLNSFELATYFLNSAKHLTLLESDAELIGPAILDKTSETQDQNDLLLAEIDELNAECY